MEDLPQELLIIILYEMDYPSIIKAGRTNHQWQKFIHSSQFWKDKLMWQFPNLDIEEYPSLSYRTLYILASINSTPDTQYPRWMKNIIIRLINNPNNDVLDWLNPKLINLLNVIDESGEMLIIKNPDTALRQIMPVGYSRGCQNQRQPRVLPYEEVVDSYERGKNIMKYTREGITYFITCNGGYLQMGQRTGFPCCRSRYREIPWENRITDYDIEYLTKLREKLVGKTMYLSKWLPIYFNDNTGGLHSYQWISVNEVDPYLKIIIQ